MIPLVRRFRRPSWRACAVGLFVLCAALLGGAYLWHRHAAAPTFPEAAKLAGQHLTQQGYQDYFRALAQKKGALYAYDVLRRAPLSADADVHSIGHVIGAVLYAQQGVSAIKYCTPEFRNACSHAVMIGFLAERGMGALPEVTKACDAVPGGTLAFDMCFHGAGHGIISYMNYDLQKSVALCKTLGTDAHEQQEYYSCVDGAVMELTGPTHDPAAWAAVAPKYFSASDPHAPCDGPYLPDDARAPCYAQFTAELFVAAGGEKTDTRPAIFAKAFSFCASVPAAADRSACYGGFGKEFVGRITAVTGRPLGAFSDEDLSMLRSWCALAKDASGERSCDRYALSALFWGGEVSPDQSFRFCQVAEGALQQDCYANLAQEIAASAQGSQEAALCARLPAVDRGVCVPSA